MFYLNKIYPKSSNNGDPIQHTAVPQPRAKRHCQFLGREGRRGRGCTLQAPRGWGSDRLSPVRPLRNGEVTTASSGLLRRQRQSRGESPRPRTALHLVFVVRSSTL